MASFDEAIPPGQVGKITAAVKTEGGRGRIEKSITVTSNDPTKGPINLRLQANIVGSVEFLPRAGLMFPAGMSWDWSGRLLVRKDQTEKGELKISDVKANVPWLTAKATPVTEPLPAAEGMPMGFPGDWILEVEVTDEAPRVQGGFQVTFKTGLAREAEASLPVSVVLQHPLRAIPMSLNIPPPPEGGEVSGTIKVLLRPGLANAKLTATASSPAFVTRVEPDGHRKFKVTVTWRADKELGEKTPRDGTVELRAGDDETLTAQVRVGVPSRVVVPPPAPPLPPTTLPGGKH